MRTSAAALAAALLGVLALPLSGAQARTAAPPAVEAPPMGWNSRTLGCSVSETSVRQAADAMAGLSQAGYRYVIIDDCWLAPQRTSGALAAHPTRFPSGIKALADHLHGRGLKLGLALSAGTKACAGGGPGSYGNEAADGALLAAWGVDYLKYDWCNIPTADFPGKTSRDIAETLYPRMRQAIGDSMVFAMNNEDGNSVPWLWGGQLATTWRTNVVNRPIADSYSTMLGIWETNSLRADHARAGSWADPDLIQAGRGGMTEAEYRSQFTLWAVGAAPLILQADPGRAPASIVANPKVIAVDQDRLGAMGRLVQSDGWYHVISKPLENGDRAIVLFNESDRQAAISVKGSRLKLPAAPRYRVEDLWTGAVSSTTGDLAASVPAHGSVMYRVGPGGQKDPSLALFELDPAAVLGDDRPSVFEPGLEREVVARVVDVGRTGRLGEARVTLAVPEGWQARRTGEASWAVTAPAGAQQAEHTLTATAVLATRTLEATSVATVAHAPGPGRSYLSDLPWLRSTSHWGPVERDQNVGGQGQGDGTPLTIEGVVHAKGLGTHARADIEFYTAGRCTTVEFQAGIDDSAGTAGSVDFEVWADGGRVAHSGVLTGAQPAKKVTASVEGAMFVRLVAANGGDNVFSDHADFADATITCT
ncbi:NPCBM/NEW2 domain-containing protein [Nonomuraea dietziae]|uniref:NPCBM/NEW2 domain-containing protein n=1 Tax=Nonomuraea dietziae TaxID=65515 RepID=UPI0033DD0FA6